MKINIFTIAKCSDFMFTDTQMMGFSTGYSSVMYTGRPKIHGTNFTCRLGMQKQVI